jgi:chemotaxis family two-component system response regulator Rcp1
MNDSASPAKPRRLNVLLVDDDDADIVLVERAIVQDRCVPEIHVVKDGLEAMWFLRRQGEFADAPRPDLILLDLHLPRKNGREVLGEIKRDPRLRGIPVVVLTTSTCEADVADTYDLQVNCYVTKPVDAEQFTRIAQAIMQFWCNVAQLPPTFAQSPATLDVPLDGSILPAF